MFSLLLLIASCALALVNILFLINTIINRRIVKSLPISHGLDREPFVSILVPACNEATKIAQCLRSIKKLDYKNYEVIVLDDQSTDDTASVAAQAFPGTRIVAGRVHPKGWVGKTYACYQLAKVAKGELLFFLDADCFIAPNSLWSMVNELQKHKLGMLGVIPKDENKKLWQKVCMPITNYFLFTMQSKLLFRLLGMRYQPPEPNMCTLLTKTAYTRSGGYAAIKGSAIEGVDLAEKVQNVSSHSLRSGAGLVSVYHYDWFSQFVNGNTRRLFASLQYSAGKATLLLAGGFMVIVLPVFVLPVAAGTRYFWLIGASVGCMYLTRLLVALRMKENPLFIVLHPLAFSVHLVILLRGMYSYRHNPVAWKHSQLPRSS